MSWPWSLASLGEAQVWQYHETIDRLVASMGTAEIRPARECIVSPRTLLDREVSYMLTR